MSVPANMGAKTMETEIQSRFPEARDRRRRKRLVIGCAETVRWKEYVLVVNSTDNNNLLSISKITKGFLTFQH